MCDKIITENGEMLGFIPDSYKVRKMCDDAVDNYDHALSLFRECSQTQKTCDNAVNTSYIIQFVPECYKTQEV